MTASANPHASGVRAPAFGPAEFGLYAVTVFAWSTSWFALHMQLGRVAAEVSLVWRFLTAAVILWLWLLVTRQPMRFSWRQHLKFAATGLLLFSFNFAMMYHAGEFLPSGLLSVVFSAASVFNILLARIVFGTPISPRVAFGGVIGVVGVGLLFLPQVLGTTLDLGALVGLGLATLGTLAFSLGNMVSSTLQRDRVPVMSASAWGMVYGIGLLALAAWVQGRPFILVPTLAYVGSLAYLAVICTVMAFWAYLTLLGRIGPSRAGYAAVMYPTFALLISTVAEGYHWTLPALAGLGLALLGNVVVLRSGRSR
ncbi:MAG: EamA family transporter [Ancalomicrobiaceae bacterium]|nr:EamA family transporter [Ancalomicrobiaceae bacterium]